MTKINYLPFFLLLSILFFNNAIVANTPEDCPEEEPTVIELVRMCNFFTAENIITPPASGNCTSSDALILYGGEKCSTQIKMNIYAANLHHSPVVGQSYSLPSEMAPIYAEYDSDFDGLYDELTEPITTFHYKGLIIENHIGEHIHLFERELTLADIQDVQVCPALPGGNPFPDNYPVRLVASAGVMYPIHDFALPTEVFSCNVFHETCGDCNDLPGSPGTLNCESSDPEYFTEICLDCGTCKDEKDLYRDKEETANLEEEDLQERSFFHKVQPNPFSDEVSLQYELTTETEVQISITDVQGKQMRLYTDFSASGMQTRTLNLAELPLGVYYCTLRTSDLVETLKIVKSK